MTDRVTASDLTVYPPGWSCRIVTERFDRYLLGALPRGELLAIAEHVEVCALCAQRLRLRETYS